MPPSIRPQPASVLPFGRSRRLALYQSQGGICIWERGHLARPRLQPASVLPFDRSRRLALEEQRG